MSDVSKKCTQCDADLPTESASSLCSKCLLQIGFETQQADGSSRSRSTDYRPTFIPPTAEELAPQFPQLEILEVIGHGGMGVVYKARQKELDRIVALKILRPGISGDANFAERFQREARALAKLNHPNIITVFDFGRRDALYYFIMEYVDGTNLRQLERIGDLNPQEALNIVPQICAALQYAHDNGVVHRDIKPENILIGKDGIVRIADFGLAKLAGIVDDAPLTGTWQVMGTPHYMAPEQFEKPTTVDHRADIYSLGVVIYELLTGELPLGRFPLPSEKVRVDVRLDEVVLRSLDKEPDRRYQHVTDVATAVEAASIPRRESRMGQAKEWIRNTAETVSEGAKSLRERSQGLKPGINQSLHWLSERKTGLGTALIWCGAIDAVLSAWTLTEITHRPNNEQEFLAFMATIAGCIAFYFGRQLRRNNMSRRLRVAAMFCLIPWFGFFIPSMVIRVILVGLGLLSTVVDTIAGDVQGGDDAPDVVDRAAAMVRSLWQAISFRVILLTIIGVAGWCGICIACSITAYEFWYQDHVPSEYAVYDHSASDMRPMSQAYESLSIRSSLQAPSHGLRLRDDLPHRDLLTLTIANRGKTANLDVYFEEGVCRTRGSGTMSSEAQPISQQTLHDWMTQAGIDVEFDNAGSVISHLHEVIQLMRRTQGTCGPLSIRDRLEFPTLTGGISALLQEDHILRGNVLPIGRLIDPNLLHCPNAERIPSRQIRATSWAESLYFGSIFTVWLIGMLRVGRVLYQQLWKPACQNLSFDEVSTDSRWRRCSLSLALVGVLTTILLLGLHNELSKDINRATPWLTSLFGGLPSYVLLRVVVGFVIVAFVIMICGFLSRPVFRRPGWWLGAFGATLAVLVLPLSLLTFPTGLAVWIALTDSFVKRQFEGMNAHADDVMAGVPV